MTSVRERQQRAAARAKLARQMAERQDAARQRRRKRAVLGGGIAVLLVAVGTVWIISSLGDEEPLGDPTVQESPQVEESPPVGDPFYVRGLVAMAKSSAPDTVGSQFFIVYEDISPTHLDPAYTVVGTVTQGMEIVDQVVAAGYQGQDTGEDQGMPLQELTFESVEVTEPAPPANGEPSPAPSGEPSAAPSGEPSAAPTGDPAASGECVYHPTDPSEGYDPEMLTDVGLPEVPDEPPTGTATMTLHTNLGDIAIEMDAGALPCTYANLAHLAAQDFYNGSTCHRLTSQAAGFIILQCGDPTGTGQGGPTYRFGEENLPVPQTGTQSSPPAPA